MFNLKEKNGPLVVCITLVAIAGVSWFAFQKKVSQADGQSEKPFEGVSHNPKAEFNLSLPQSNSKENEILGSGIKASKELKEVEGQDKKTYDGYSNPVTAYIKSGKIIPQIELNYDTQRASMKNRQPFSGAVQKFDVKKYVADPSAYFHRLDWNRQHDILQEAPDVRPLLTLDGEEHVSLSISAGGQRELKIQAEAGWPVTFISKNRGVFDNDIPLITVQADAEGVATVQFKAIEGTVAEVDVVAASPAHSGKVHYNIIVLSPPLAQKAGPKTEKLGIEKND